jgi:hypothetical protein
MLYLIAIFNFDFFLIQRRIAGSPRGRHLDYLLTDLCFMCLELLLLTPPPKGILAGEAIKS